jgi:hypothetical protein
MVGIDTAVACTYTASEYSRGPFHLLVVFCEDKMALVYCLTLK